MANDPGRLLIATATSDLPVAEHVIRELLGEKGDLEIVPWQGTEGPDHPHWKQMVRADAFLVRSGTIGRRLLRASRNLSVISLHGAGVDQVDVEAARELGVTVTNVPGGNSASVAEMTIALGIALLRGIVKADRRLRLEGWHAARFQGRELGARAWGIVGMGAIGEQVAYRASSMGARLFYFDPYVGADREKNLLGIAARLRSLRDLMKQSEIVSVHVPLTSETRGLIGHEELKLLGPEGYLINVARGAVVDQEALVRAIRKKIIAGAALDVFEAELLPADSPLLQLDDVILTPHLAGSTTECLDTIAREATMDILRHWEGKRPRYPVSA